MNREEKILEKTYRDRLWVRRRQLRTDDAGESRTEEVCVHTDVKCALSTAGSSSPEKETKRSTTTDEFTIFTAPHIRMQSGDIASVTTETGQNYLLKTGRSHVFPSHAETPAKAEGMV